MADSIMLSSVTRVLLSRHNGGHLIVLSLGRRALVIIVLSPGGVHAVTPVVDRTSSHRWLRRHKVWWVVVLANQITV